MTKPEPKPVTQGKAIAQKKAKAKDTFVDVDTIEICDDPPPKNTTGVSKYEAKFSSLKFGQALKCPSDKTSRVAQSLRDWMKVKSITGKVVSRSDYGDGKGRVWMLRK